MDYGHFQKFLQGHSLADLAICEARSVDDNCWLIYLKFRDGAEVRVAVSSEAEARHDCADILRWRDHPQSIPPPTSKAASFPIVGLSWAVGLLCLLWAAWYGVSHYWLVSGWVFTRHFFSGFILAGITFRLFCASVSTTPFEWKFYAMSMPLIIILTLANVSAFKTVNAVFGPSTPLHIQGRITDKDDQVQTLYFPKSGDTVHIPESTLTVLDDISRQVYKIDVPGWVMERDKVQTRMIWEDEFYRGAFGWYYRKGTAWDSFDYTPKVHAPPLNQ